MITKVAGTTISEMFGVVKGNSRKSNIIAATLIYAPNIPSYLIPSYSQASQTGNAVNVRKHEGLRGLLTGGMDGAAVGALTAGKGGLSIKRVAIFALIGGMVDYISSKILPYFGERLGKLIYERKNKPETLKNLANKQPNFIGISSGLVSSPYNRPISSLNKRI